MVSLKEYQKRIARLSNHKFLVDMLFLEIKRHEEEFLKLQKQQLGKGEDNEGSEIGTYSFATENIAKTQNPRKPKKAGEPYNFEYTGSFFDDFVLEVNGDNARIFSKDSKTPLLIKKYDNLLGLQPENLREVVLRFVLPAFLGHFKKQLGLR